MTTVRNDEVTNMMVQAASRDLAEPVQAVEKALDVLPAEQQSTFMDALHAALLAQGHDPTEAL